MGIYIDDMNFKSPAEIIRVTGKRGIQRRQPDAKRSGPDGNMKNTALPAEYLASYRQMAGAQW